MKHASLIRDIVFTFFLILLSSCGYRGADHIALSGTYGSHMVVQRNKDLVFHGKASPGRRVKVTFNELVWSGRADADSSWVAVFPPVAEKGPYSLRVEGRNKVIEAQDILAGDVFLGSGQSNMQYRLKEIDAYGKEKWQADFPEIRFFVTGEDYSRTPGMDVKKGEWKVCGPGTVGEFSAVGYYFCREVHRDENIPVGMIVSAIGGSTIKGWIPDTSKHPSAAEEIPLSSSLDTSMVFFDYDDSAWDDVQLPGAWELHGYKDYDGYAYYRKRFSLPADQWGDSLLINLGMIDDEDATWINGVRIGTTTVYDLPRSYPVHAGLLREGENLITVRVLDASGLGGFWSAPEEMNLSRTNGDVLLDLAGEWKFSNSIAPRFPPDRLIPSQPGVMFNAMIAPFGVFPVKGILWYQGEADESGADLYAPKFKRLILSWREYWEAPGLPFLFVQIPNYLEKTDSAVQRSSSWARLREAQADALDLDQTGMAVTIDIGEAEDIHPMNKEDVGKRLSRIAGKLVYHRDLVHSGPVYASHRLQGDTVVLSFAETGSGLTYTGSGLQGFALAGADDTFFKARAWIHEDQVLLHSPDVQDPRAIRYGWADNPDCNLYNREGLPAAPFRTDR